MLRLHPDKRAKASDLVHHNWLEGVLVQGEIDVIRRLEIDEAVKKRGLLEREQQQQQQQQQQSQSSSLSSSVKESSRLLDQSERDAMKPVDESVISVNGRGDDDDEEEGEGDEDEEDEDEESKRLKHQTPLLAAPPVPTMASGIARALQSNTNPATQRGSGSRSTGKRRT